MMSNPKAFPNDAYTVGWICALDTEMAVAEAMLDEIHEDIQEPVLSDNNSYTLGRIRDHNIVIAGLPAGVYGTTSAANVAKDMLRTFKHIRFGLMVGIGGGIPSEEHDIRLGDVVVSQPSGTNGGVIQHDRGKTFGQDKFERTGSLNSPPAVLLAALTRLKTKHKREDSKISQFLDDVVKRFPKMKKEYVFQETQNDHLFRAEYDHPPNKATCESCDSSQEVFRVPRDSTEPRIHYGTIASGNQVIKNGVARERLQKDLDALCVEMEAAGLMSDFPCLVIRGICDYADSHKNKVWQPYAAATAAAFAKELLQFVSAKQVLQEKTVIEVCDLKLRDIAEEHLQVAIEQADRQQTRYQNKEEVECHQSFAAGGSYEAQKDRNPVRVDGTCKWVLTHPQYQSWVSSHHNDLLWISADPGCGKSVLSKSLVDIDLKASSSRSTCYFFFKDNEEQNNYCIAICAVLHQLFTYRPGLLSYAIPSWKRYGSKLRYEKEELWNILLSAVTDSAAGDVICILDALDECERQDRLALIDRLKRFRSSSSVSRKFTVKFLVTSRPYENIQDQWTGIQVGISTIWLRGEEKNDDIAKEIDLVVESSVSRISDEKNIPQDVQDLLQKKLKRMNHRTYLWLYLVMEEIRSSLKRTTRTYNRILNTIPPTVEEAYEKILSKSTNREETKYLLQIIVTASRPLTLTEIDVAFNLATQKKCCSFRDLDLDRNHIAARIRNLCGLFVYVADSKVFLIHQTAKEFLVSANAEPTVVEGTWRHSIQERASEMLMTELCVQYLLFEEFDGPPFHKNQDDEDLRKPPQSLEYKFIEYSAINWPSHFRAARVHKSSSLLHLALILYNADSRRLQSWFSRYWKSESPYREQPQQLTSLHIAAITGHEAVVQQLLATGRVDADARDELGQTPLSRAVEGGHEAVVQQLLATGRVDADARDEWGWTPLWMAAAGGHEAVVQQLLATGRVDTDAKDDENRTPLWMAAEGGHEAVVQQLLATGRVDTDARDDKNRTPLWRAVEGGHEAVVRQLLATGRVDADARDKWGRTPLWMAAAGGYEAVVQQLLATGWVNTDARDDKNRTPLWMAAEGGHEAVVQQLLATGQVDANARDSEKRTPLRMAAEGGYEAVVQQLLATGRVDADARDKWGRTPLWMAAEGGHEAVVQQLLATGRVDADARDKWGRTPLWMAAKGGHEAVVQQLLATGRVDADARADENRTPLWMAAEGGHEAVVRQLLATGQVDADARDDKNRTPLWRAAEGGYEAVVQQLLATGKVDADARDKWGRTPLRMAAEGGHKAVVQQLLATGRVDADARDKWGRTPLWMAAEGGHEAVVRQLLATGRVDADARDEWGRTPLWRAAEGGHEAVVQLLESCTATY